MRYFFRRLHLGIVAAVLHRGSSRICSHLRQQPHGNTRVCHYRESSRICSYFWMLWRDKAHDHPNLERMRSCSLRRSVYPPTSTASQRAAPMQCAQPMSKFLESSLPCRTHKSNGLKSAVFRSAQHGKTAHGRATYLPRNALRATRASPSLFNTTSPKGFRSWFLPPMQKLRMAQHHTRASLHSTRPELAGLSLRTRSFSIRQTHGKTCVHA